MRLSGLTHLESHLFFAQKGLHWAPETCTWGSRKLHGTPCGVCAGAEGAEPNHQQPEEDDLAIGAIEAKQKADSIVLRTLRMVLLVSNLKKAWV